MITNTEFIQAVFKEDAPFAHVTDFTWDPNDIPPEEHLRAWRGDWASRYQLRQGTNQYFCVSIFNPDEKGVARRRKALFLRTRCIVLDDVREKLDPVQAARLPAPSWILETSPGSEQWGYILTEPCHDRHRVENLLDGLVASDLAPSGNDPGMKGVTRYVRLPEGVNTKASKLVDGRPRQCVMLEWHPERTTTLEALAAPFHVDLDAVRRDARVDGAANVPDHPVLQIPDIIHIKEVRSDGRFDITCPWVDEHTGAVDNGAAVFTNNDGTLGFKCHHGACEGRSARDLVAHVEAHVPGWGEQFSLWKAVRLFTSDATVTPSPDATPKVEPIVTVRLDTTLNEQLEILRRAIPGSRESRDQVEKLLRVVDDLSVLDQKHWHQAICDIMGWSKKDLTAVVKDLRKGWQEYQKKSMTFLDNLVYVKAQNQIYEYSTGIFISVDAMHNSFAHIDADIKKTALVEGAIKKVDRMDFAPNRAAIFEENGVVYANLWTPKKIPLGCPGDPSPWLRHIELMGFGPYKKHILQYMAFTLKYPEIKINHMLIIGGFEGTGKDFIVFPAIWGNPYSRSIHSDELYSDFNDYLIGTKLLVVNEGDTADRDPKHGSISNKLKPLAAAPPERLRVNQKGIPAIEIRNIVNVIMTTNSQLPIKLHGTSRRIFPVWSDLNCRDEVTLEVLPEWREYWIGMWNWMMNGGCEACVWYLRNEVDLSDFVPGAAPPVTGFMREMQESSKSLQQQTLETFIRHRVGAFASDVVTLQDALTTLRAGALSDMHAYCDTSWFTPDRLNRMFKSMPSCSMLHSDDNLRLWAVRNGQQYARMPFDQVKTLYETNMQKIRSGVKLKVV